MYFEASKIKWFEELLLQTFFSFSIPYHIRKISICLKTLENTRKIKGSECGSKSKQIRLFISLPYQKNLNLSANPYKHQENQGFYFPKQIEQIKNIFKVPFWHLDFLFLKHPYHKMKFCSSHEHFQVSKFALGDFFSLLYI